MLKRKLDARTVSFVKQRADFFFAEQVKRLGPLPAAHIEPAAAVSAVAAAPRKRARTRKTLTT